MKTLMIAPQPFFQPRGTPFSVLHRCKTLSKLGYEIDLLTYPIGQDVEIENVNIIRSYQVPFIKNIAVGPSKPKIFLDMSLYAKAVRLLKQNKYDLLHTHEEAGFMGIRLARKFELLHLYDMHSSLPQQLNNFKYSKSQMLLRVFDKLENATIESANAVITICPELWHYVTNKFPGKFNKLIENVADNSTVFGEHKTDPEFKRRWNINGEKLILYTGTFEAYQGLDLLIQSSKCVVAEENNVKFLVVGGKPEQVEASKKLAEETGTADHFIFTGQRPPEEIPAFMDIADILVSPRIEGNNTPLKIYSYLRSGIPVVATRHLTHTQVLNDDVALLTDITPDDFGAGILKAVQDKSLVQKVVTNAQELSEREYSYEAYIKKTKEVYQYLEALLKRKRG
ncbi:MAG: glycosyltransferase family 4 protein [Deferribacteres bacterium]|nr:glycosyltransferase family 4 protein [candidate division KSB1 bacterium]MCB9503349.1 glycosyltransferase family 4 protein [Deferribacteres bacterium]